MSDDCDAQTWKLGSGHLGHQLVRCRGDVGAPTWSCCRARAVPGLWITLFTPSSAPPPPAAAERASRALLRGRMLRAPTAPQGRSFQSERSPPPSQPLAPASLRSSLAKFRTGSCQLPLAQPGSPRPQLPLVAAAVLSSRSRPAAASIRRDRAASSVRVVRGNLFLNVPALSYHR